MTPNAYQTQYHVPVGFNGPGASFVTKLNATGSALVYSTYFGQAVAAGATGIYATGIAVDSGGNAVICGETDAGNFPSTVGVIQPSVRGSRDAFVAKFNLKGDKLIFATLLGGSGADRANGVALDQFGSVYVVGTTISTDFPITGQAFQKQFAGSVNTGGFINLVGDAFVSKLSTSGTELQYSTFLGGSGGDIAAAIAVDRSTQTAYVTGTTTSGNFPVTPDAFQKPTLNQSSAFITGIAPDGGSLTNSTYFGGVFAMYPMAIAFTDGVYVAGYTNSPGLPTTPDAFQPLQPGRLVGFAAKFKAGVYPAVKTVVFDQNPVLAETAAHGVVTLDSPAPKGGASVVIKSAYLALDRVSMITVTVPQGSVSAPFAIPTYKDTRFASNYVVYITAYTKSGAAGAELEVSLTSIPPFH